MAGQSVSAAAEGVGKHPNTDSLREGYPGAGTSGDVSPYTDLSDGGSSRKKGQWLRRKAVVEKESSGTSFCLKKTQIRCYAALNHWKHTLFDCYANFTRRDCAHGQRHDSSGFGKWRRQGEA